MNDAQSQTAATTLPSSARLTAVKERVLPTLKTMVTEKNVSVGDAVFLRAFKESKEMELWMKGSKSKGWVLVKTYAIKTWGGGVLGPKLKEGDGQAPEGFYGIGPKQMNPYSSYHLSMNVGYPNAFDQAHGRTGSLIMIHGSVVSVGCFAMTDPLIEEIYLLCDAALAAGKKGIAVHLFPFRMTDERMLQAEGNANLPFWKNLKQGYDFFEREKIVPLVGMQKSGYTFTKP